MSREERERRRAEYYAEAIKSFPFELVEVAGHDALNAWQRLKSQRRGIPVVLGDDESIENLIERFHPSYPTRSVAEILVAAAQIRFPEDLFVQREAENAEADEDLAKLLSGPDANLPSIVESRDVEGFVRGYIERWSGGPVQIEIPLPGDKRILSAKRRGRISRADHRDRNKATGRSMYRSQAP